MSDEVIHSSGICQNCFIKFNEFDEHQSISLRIQNELILLYETSLITNTSSDFKLNIKLEDDSDDYGIVEVMLESNAHEIYQESDYYRKFMKRSRKQKEVPSSLTSSETGEKRLYKRKKNLDEGLIVVEVDGQKIYQCDVCKKLCKDRYKLKIHREIHTTERTICCNECGALFKTLTCKFELYLT